MNIKRIMLATAGGLMALGLTQAAFAQTTPTSVNNSTFNAVLTPSVQVYTPGTSGATLGTLALTNNTSGNISFSAIPITFSPTNGAAFSQLSNCQLYNTANQPIASTMTASGTISSPTGTFTLNSPLTVNAGGTTSVHIRCDIAGSMPSTGSFPVLLTSAPVLTGSIVIPPPATTTPSLIVSVSPSSSVNLGAQNAPLAYITLDARQSGVPIRITSLPISTTFTGGLGAGNFTDCRVVNSNNPNVALNTGSNVSGTLVGGSGTINFDSPLTVNAGTQTTLILTCDVSPFAPSGTVLGVSVSPNLIPAVNTNTGVTFTPVASPTLPSSGTTFVLGASTGTPGTPGLPNTGMGGNAINFAVLMSALLGGTALMLARKRFL